MMDSWDDDSYDSADWPACGPPPKAPREYFNLNPRGSVATPRALIPAPDCNRAHTEWRTGPLPETPDPNDDTEPDFFLVAYFAGTPVVMSGGLRGWHFLDMCFAPGTAPKPIDRWMRVES